MVMTKDKPQTPGWYWYELPGSWALQPVLVFDGEPGRLMYTIDSICYDYDAATLDGFWMSNASDNAMWSDAPIETPNAKLTGDPQPHRGASSEQSERG